MVRAAVLREYNQPLAVEQIELAPTGPGLVRVRIAATGVCHSDLSMVRGRFPHPVPAVLGHEGAGVVTEVGPGVTGFSLGDHVILHWSPPCGSCPFCRRGEPYLCQRAIAATFESPYATLHGETVYRGLGTATFADETLTLERALVKIDQDVPFEVAALVGCAVTTGVGAVLNTAVVPAGATVAVVGCGGVGLSVVMGARYAGASRVVAIDLSAERRALARELGATDALDGAGDPAAAVMALTDGLGVDYAFEVAGRPATLRLAWTITRRGGTTVAVGSGSPNDPVTFDMFELFFFARTLKGCVYGSADPARDFPRFLRLWRDGVLPVHRLITRRIRLDEVNDAFAAMEAGEGARSVVVNG